MQKNLLLLLFSPWALIAWDVETSSLLSLGCRTCRVDVLAFFAVVLMYHMPLFLGFVLWNFCFPTPFVLRQLYLKVSSMGKNSKYNRTKIIKSIKMSLIESFASSTKGLWPKLFELKTNVLIFQSIFRWRLWMYRQMIFIQSKKISSIWNNHITLQNFNDSRTFSNFLNYKVIVFIFHRSGTESHTWQMSHSL